jgi:hypothetical protein
MMNRKGYGRKLSWPYLRYYPGICFEGLIKTMKNVCQDCRCPDRDLNQRSPEYEEVVSTTLLQRMVRLINISAPCLNEVDAYRWAPSVHLHVFR